MTNPVSRDHETRAFRRVFSFPKSARNEFGRDPLLRGVFPTSLGYGPNWHGHHCVRAEPLREFIVIYCVQGNGWYKSPAQEYEIRPGDLLFVHDNWAHSYGARHPNPWSIYWSHFQGKLAKGLVETAEAGFGGPVLHVGMQPLIRQIFEEILNGLTLGAARRQSVYYAGCFQRLLGYIIALPTMDARPRLEKTGFGTIKSFMYQHIREELTLAQMAARCDMSRYHFARKFRSQFGLPPMDYFIRVKMQAASQLLDTTGRNIADIAHELGYEDPYYFSRVFKRVTGLSPKHYRAAPKA